MHYLTVLLGLLDIKEAVGKNSFLYCIPLTIIYCPSTPVLHVIHLSRYFSFPGRD